MGTGKRKRKSDEEVAVSASDDAEPAVAPTDNAPDEDDRSGSEKAQDSGSDDELSHSGSEDEEGKADSKKKRKKNPLDAPPTFEEVAVLRETEQLYNSNLLRLQADNFLEDVSIDYRKTGTIEKLLHSLRTVLLHVKPHTVKDVADAETFAENAKVPLSCPSVSLHGISEMTIPTPADVAVLGSFMLQTVAKPDCTVDIGIKIPEDYLREKDFLDFRYIDKRALFLANVASFLRKGKAKVNFADAFRSVTTEYFDTDESVSVLSVVPDTSVSEELGRSSFHIRIFPILDEEAFNARKLIPTRCNVREDEQGLIHSLRLARASGTIDPLVPPRARALPHPTPLYNATILRDMRATALIKACHATLRTAESLKRGAMLLKRWMRCQGASGTGGFSGAACTALIAHLAGQKRLSADMSYYQVFTTVLDILATLYPTEPFRFSTEKPAGESEESEAQRTVMLARFGESEELDSDLASVLAESYPMCVVDDAGYNVFAFISHHAINLVRSRAQAARRVLPRSDIGIVERLCGKPEPLLAQFDAILTCTSTLRGTDLDHAVAVLERALGARASLVRGIASEKEGVLFGIDLNRSEAFRVVDIGPAADAGESAEAFRRFWKDRAELRRFRDGSICEVVPWERFSRRRHLIVGEVCREALLLHCGVAREDVDAIIGQLDELILPPIAEQDAVEGTPSTVTALGAHGSHVQRVFDAVGRAVRSLELPIRVHDVRPLSPALRDTAAFPPFPHPLCTGSKNPTVDEGVLPTTHGSILLPLCSRSLDVVEGVVQLESSSAWPRDRAAGAALKAAVYARIALLLNETGSVYASACTDCVDILANGYCVRLRVLAAPEADAARLTGERSAAAAAATAASASATGGARNARAAPDAANIRLVLAELRGTPKPPRSVLELFRGPMIHDMCAVLQRRFPMFSTGVRLCKRWMAAHMLLGEFSDAAVEMLAMYAHAQAPRAPETAIALLVRFWLVLAETDFALTPIVVDPAGEIDQNTRRVLSAAFDHGRAEGSAPPLYICHSADPLSEWTTARDAPSAAVLRRAAALARQALRGAKAATRRRADASAEAALRAVFATPLSDYDVVLHLDPRQIAFAWRAVRGAGRRGGKALAAARSVPPPGRDFDKARASLAPLTDPADALLAALRATHGDVALFFRDAYGGRAIGVVLRPEAFAAAPFAARRAAERHPAGAAHLPALVDTWSALGGDLVARVQVQSERVRKALQAP